jgi:uncharacterized OB-fold protein
MRVIIHRCSSGHEFFHEYACCPQCHASLRPTEVDGTAELIGDTTVRVNPSGNPFRLGLARLPSGAATLCIVADERALRSGVEVTLNFDGDIYHAVAMQPR